MSSVKIVDHLAHHSGLGKGIQAEWFGQGVRFEADEDRGGLAGLDDLEDEQVRVSPRNDLQKIGLLGRGAEVFGEVLQELVGLEARKEGLRDLRLSSQAAEENREKNQHFFHYKNLYPGFTFGSLNWRFSSSVFPVLF